MTDTLVKLDNVAKSYKYATALLGVSFDLKDGEVFGYIGPNGAGKTTTLKILAGLLTKFDGSVRIAGKSVPEHRADVHQLIGFLPQSAGFQNWRTTDSALRSLGLLSGVDPSKLDKRIGEWLERFDLTKKRQQKIKKLSGGMVQKLGLIQALLHEPKLLILDEPLSGLDPVSRNLVKTVVRECKKRGTTVLFSSHILSDVQDVADSVGILHQGKLLTSGSIDDLKAELPVNVAIQFSTAPADVGFLNAHPAVETATDSPSGAHTLRLTDGADVDAVIHSLVEKTLAGGGRLRRVGIVDPDLDALYAQYISAADEENKAAEAKAKDVEVSK